MSGFIEDFYYGNIEPQECCSELKSKLKKKVKLSYRKRRNTNFKIKWRRKGFVRSLHKYIQ